MATLLAVWLLGPTVSAATLTVTTTADLVDGSLRKAIASAAQGDTIVFQIPLTDPGYNPATGHHVVTLSGKTADEFDLILNKNLTIDGSAQKIVVHRAADGPANFRLFTVQAGANVTLRRLWISNGNVTAVASLEGRIGGGIYNQGNLTIRDCIFTGNAARSGGAIYHQGTSFRVSGSTFSGNSSTDSAGAIYSLAQGPAVIDRCTFYGNSASQAGAIFRSVGPLTITSSTIFGNTATAAVGGVDSSSVSAGPLRLENNIIVGNTGPGAPDVYGPLTSDGHNLIGSPEGNTEFTGPGDRVGVLAVQINLNALGDYGGFTPTMPPRAGSLAIDRGKQTVDANGPVVTTDQRGFPRPVDRPEGNGPDTDGSDVGAAEVGTLQPGPTFTVTALSQHNDGNCTTDDCTLTEAMARANAESDANTILFRPEVTGVLGTETPVPQFNGPVNIVGPGANLLRLFGQVTLEVLSDDVSISGLAIVDGKNTTSGKGGAIFNSGGLTLTDCSIEASVVATAGGGIYNDVPGTLTLNRCTIRTNEAQFGGGLYSEGTVTATNCTFYANSAERGGAIMSRFVEGKTLTLRNCTIVANTASDAADTGAGGGGIYAEGGPGNTLHHISNSLIALNNGTMNPDLRGAYTSDGHNLIGNIGNAFGFSNNVKGDLVGTPGQQIDPRIQTLANNGGPTLTAALNSDSPAINAGDDALAPPADQRGYGRNGTSDIGAYEFKGLLPATLANISTRLRVETGDNVLIGGFIVTGTEQKKVVIRAIGPSLSQFFSDTLYDPTLELRDGAGTLIDSNDNWINSPNKQAIVDSGVAPSNDLESAIVATLPANGAGYTAIVRGVNGATGIGVVEAYDLDRTVDSKLANISTRGLVQTGNNVLIAGTIVLGTQSQKVIIRAIGPSLPFPGTLENPTLELRDGNGGLLEANDNWVDSPNKQAIIDSTVPPTNDLESAIVRTLTPAAYTAIVRGANETTGIAVVEVYALR